MTIQEKYQKLRPLISDGDLMLFRGNKLISKIIQTADSSYFNHVGIVIKVHDSFFIVDSNSNGVEADRLSERVSKYKRGDLALLKPLSKRNFIDEQMSLLLTRSDRQDIEYDFINGAKELLNRRLKIKLKINNNNNRDICSDFVSSYAINLEMVNEDFKKLRVAFPQDYIRYANNVSIYSSK